MNIAPGDQRRRSHDAAQVFGEFGARLHVPVAMDRLTFEEASPVLHLGGGETVTAKCLLIATGADYNRLASSGVSASRGPASTTRRRPTRRRYAAIAK